MYLIDYLKAVNITLNPSNMSPRYWSRVMILNGDKSIITISGLYKLRADKRTIEKSKTLEKFTKYAFFENKKPCEMILNPISVKKRIVIIYSI